MNIILFLPLLLWANETNSVSVEGKILPPLYATPMPQLPNTYLIDGTNTIPYQESKWRRYDVVFFVAVPISFYFFMNILMIKNSYLYEKEGTYLSDTDWNYIYLVTFLVPLFAAYHDQVFFERMQYLSTEQQKWNIPIYQKEF